MEKQKLSIEDFKLNKMEANREIEKMLGLAAAACHTTCNPDANYEQNRIDWVDHE